MEPFDLARYFDHTILKPAATSADIEQLCEEASHYNFYSVCVNPVHVALAAEILAGSEVTVCAVVGFPLGATTSEVKAQETTAAIADGADEIDMVINIGALKEGDEELVEADICAVVAAARGRVVKVIIETCLLTDDEKILACRLAEQAGAHFVKTSTGFSTGGATVADVSLMRQSVGEGMQVKASGGIKTLADARAMIAAGADRLGASAGVAIMHELEATGK